MFVLDFASGGMTSIGSGYAPHWSPDGRRIAFTREYFDYSGPEFRYYEPLYVMNADGTNERRITLSRIPNHAYTAVDWSRDGRRLLVNRRIYLDPSLTISRFSVRLVDVDARTVTTVTDGQADPGGWFQH
jgi:Tol biopolymer transport system component